MRVLIAAGGTGGHIYPALAVAEELRARGCVSRIGWIGDPERLEGEVVRRHPWIEFLPLSSRGFARSQLRRWPGSVARSCWGLGRGIALVRRFKPDVVFGTGGHASFAPVAAAAGLRLPTAIHEQNARMGLANRLLAPIVDRVFLSYPDTTGVPRRARTCVVGNPVRREVAAISPQLGDELLVVGGSGGSRGLVEAVVRAAPELARVPELRVRLIVGKAAPVEEVAGSLAWSGVAAEVVQYAEPFAGVLARARLVVARAGATTAAEVAVAGRPTVFVPWEGAAHGHQWDNARALAQYGGGVVVTEEEARHGLGRLVAELWADERRLRDMASRARAAARPNAAQAVAEALLALVEEGT